LIRRLLFMARQEAKRNHVVLRDRQHGTELIARRTLLARSGAALVGLTMLDAACSAIFAAQPGEEVVAWLDQPPPIPAAAAGVVKNL
jgi:hypothetical protein